MTCEGLGKGRSARLTVLCLYQTEARPSPARARPEPLLRDAPGSAGAAPTAPRRPAARGRSQPPNRHWLTPPPAQRAGQWAAAPPPGGGAPSGGPAARNLAGRLAAVGLARPGPSASSGCGGGGCGGAVVPLASVFLSAVSRTDASH